MRFSVSAAIPLILCLCSTFSRAQERTNVALTDLQSEGVDASTARVITDRLRTELFKTGVFTVVERGQMEEILKEQGFQQSGCTNDACVVEVGQILGVKGMLAGSVGKVGELYTLNVRMIDVGSATITQSVNVDCKCDVEKVLTVSTLDIARQLADAVQGRAAGDTERARKAVRGAGAENGRFSRGQRVRLWTFGSLAVAGAGFGIYMNSVMKEHVDEANAIAMSYEEYVRISNSNDDYPVYRDAYESEYLSAEKNALRRNISYGVAGVLALGMTLSFFF